MLRRARVVLCLVTTALGATFCIAAPAHAGAPSVAAHGLGALPPQGHVAPPVFAAADLPDSVDLRQWAVPVGNQGAVGSCVTWAINYGLLGWLSNKTGHGGQPFAPMYTYSQIVVTDNDGNDMGSYPSDALAVAVTQGSDTKAHYSHDDFDWHTPPSDAERANAANYKASTSHVLFQGANQDGNVTAMKQAIAGEHPIAITIPVRPGFDNMGSDPNAVDTDYSNAWRGFHEVLAVGYDEAGLIIQNSWSTGWGFGGFGRLSWAVAKHDVMEADTIDGFAAPSPPAVSTPVVTLLGSGTTAAGTVPYKIEWHGTPGTSGAITSYEVAYRRDAGPLVPVTLASELATSFTLNAQLGHQYHVYVTAHAGADYASAQATSAAFQPKLVQENEMPVMFVKRWTRTTVNTASAKGIKFTGDANGTVTLTVNAARFAWVTSAASNRGSARVYIDGKLITGVNTYSKTTQMQRIVFAKNYSSSGKHTIQIVNSATPGHPYIDLDAFVVSS